MANLTNADIQKVITVIQDLYQADSIPWVCGYSGGKDSTATVQLVWEALNGLPKKALKKDVHIISTDTLVESPVVAAWQKKSLLKMTETAEKSGLPIHVHQLTPQIKDTFWVNLIGRGYPYPRATMRWCTNRLKIQPANNFIEAMVSSAGEAILVLGTRKSESSQRGARMEKYEKQRVREYLSPDGSHMNSYVFSPIEDWNSNNVWQYLMSHENTWGQSNKELLAMYSGASADGECPLVLDTSTPSCGNSRMGCWVCTLVAEDKSMAAMIQNDEEKAWMLPLLEFRNEIAADNETDRDRRDFRRMNGRLTYHKGRLVHGPYKKEVREHFLRRLLEVEKFVNQNGPKELEEHPLITHEELQTIRHIWLTEKNEFDDTLPKIYKEVTGKDFQDSMNHPNRYFGEKEWNLLKETCAEVFPEEELMMNLCSSGLNLEASYTMKATRRGIRGDIEQILKRNMFKNEEDACRFYEKHNDITPQVAPVDDNDTDEVTEDPEE